MITFSDVVFDDDNDVPPVSAENLNNIEVALKTVCDGGVDSGLNADVVRGKNLVAKLDLTRKLEGHWSFADLPEYPDGDSPAYFESDWTTVDTFAPYATGSILSVSNNHLVVNRNVSPNRDFQRSTAIPAGRNLRIKIKNTGNIGSAFYLENSSFTRLTLTVKNDYLIGTIPTLAVDTMLVIRIEDTNSDPIWVKWVYVGDDSYKSLALDTPALLKNATVTGATPSSYSPTTTSLYFDKINDTVSCPIRDFSTETEFSISLKVDNRMASNESGTLFVLGSGTDTNGLAVKTTGAFDFVIEGYSAGATETLSSLGLSLTNTYSHLVITYNNSGGLKTCSIYKDGVQLIAPNFVNALKMPLGTLTLGSQAGLNFFKGYIADVSLYSRALSLEEVWELYQNSNDMETLSLSSVNLRGTPPKTISSPGVVGTIAYDSSNLYVCIAPNSWKRASLGTW